VAFRGKWYSQTILYTADLSYIEGLHWSKKNYNIIRGEKSIEHEISHKFISVYRYMRDRSVIIEAYNLSMGVESQEDQDSGLFMAKRDGQNWQMRGMGDGKAFW
jgi:hypothetical protein